MKVEGTYLDILLKEEKRKVSTGFHAMLNLLWIDGSSFTISNSNIFFSNDLFLRLVVNGLSEGIEYQFRVKAENEIGIGLPSKPSKPVVAKEIIEIPGQPNNLKVIDTTR